MIAPSVQSFATLEDDERKSLLGQFLTPEPVADLMASLFDALPPQLRLLDAGAGAGNLIRAFVRRLCRERTTRMLEVTAWEVDSEILPKLEESLEWCRSECERNGIKFSSLIRHGDFILELAPTLAGEFFSGSPPAFDVAITNPPYRKIHASSPERLVLRRAGVETNNLYTAFLTVIQRLLVPGGQLVGITPRSFCNGPYFQSFRDEFLTSMYLRRIHLFDSREAAFRNDAVLQENVILHAVRSGRTPTTVRVSSSSGEPGATVYEKELPFEEVVHPGDARRFIHLPVCGEQQAARQHLANLKNSLRSLGLSVSTGPVVDFRLKSALRQNPEPGSVPLLYPCHFNRGTIHWPKDDSTKPNAILENEDTRRWLLPSGTYVLTKRFTSKEERRRVVACVLDPRCISAQRIGLENHLNYFHQEGAGMDENLARGLFLFLNSTVLDDYFRRFSGHTQVNATDLRNIPYPDRKTLITMGRSINRLDLCQVEIDRIVTTSLHVK